MADRKKKPGHDDAWWAAQRHAYIEKNDILLSDYPSWEWVSPYDFWRTIFPEGFLQPRGEEVPWHERGGGHPNGIAIQMETLQEGRRDHTAYQWCDLGFVPIAEARWRLTRYGGNSAWYYCSPWDVRYDPDRAKELLETGPREYDRLPDGRPYDGRPWWQA